MKQEKLRMFEKWGYISFSLLLIVISSLSIWQFVDVIRLSSVTTKIGFIPCEINKTTGLVGAKGDFYPLDNDSDKISTVINGYYVANNALYKVVGKPSDTIPILRNLESYGIMNDERMPVCRENSYITIINTDGKELFQLKEIDDKDVLGCFSYSDSKLRVRLEDESYVYVDKQGQKLFDMRYSYATDFKNGYAVTQTTNQNKDLYSLVDNDAQPLFTFESEKNKDIVVSYDIELLSAKQNEKIVIYDFSGKRVLECPTKVCGIYAFCKDGFIFYNDDDEFGLMSYKGETLIQSRYKQFIPNGNNFLVRTGNDVISLVDNKGTIQKEYSGKDILDFRKGGYDFPCVIETPDDDFMIIDLEGNIITEGNDIDFDQDYIEKMNFIRSVYFPSDEILNTIVELCGDENDVSSKYGASLYNPAYRSPQDYGLDSFPINELIGNNLVSIPISTGVNYRLRYGILFDLPIVLRGETELNDLARLESVELSVEIYGSLTTLDFCEKCVREFSTNKGCKVLYSGSFNYLIENNMLLYFVTIDELKHPWYKLNFRIMRNEESNRKMYSNHYFNKKRDYEKD